MIKAIIFDMDGVISDTEKSRFIILKELLEEKGIEINNSYFNKFLGLKTKVLLRKYFSNLLNEEDIFEIHKNKSKLLKENPNKYILSFSNVLETIKQLYKKGYVLAIASSSSESTISLILTKLRLEKYFKVIVSSDDVKKFKPNPEIYNYTVEKLNFNKNECVVIEDSKLGIKSAKNAGLYCIAISNSYNEDQLVDADKIIDNLIELLDFY